MKTHGCRKSGKVNDLFWDKIYNNSFGCQNFKMEHEITNSEQDVIDNDFYDHSDVTDEEVVNKWAICLKVRETKTENTEDKTSNTKDITGNTEYKTGNTGTKTPKPVNSERRGSITDDHFGQLWDTSNSTYEREVLGPDPTLNSTTRVLNPPGGRSSIFADEEPQAPKRSSKYHMASSFELGDEQPTHEELLKQRRKSSTKPIVNPVTGEVMIFPGDGSSSESSSEKDRESPVGEPSTPPKSQRIPPGGFSSPLW